MRALVFGGSGMTGQSLLTQLSADKRFTSVISAGRRTLDGPEDRVQQVVVDMEKLDKSEDIFECDIVFVCLGTTIAKAGSKQAFEKVDLHYVSVIAALAASKEVQKIVVISSIGANAESSNFYLRTKGKMEKSILESGVSVAIIVRPGLLLGQRKEFRFGEKIAAVFMKTMDWMLIGKWSNYRSISASDVASGMIQAGLQIQQHTILPTHELRKLAANYHHI